MIFDFQKFYDRMANELPNDCRVVEVGIANGDSALYLAQKLVELGKEFTLYMVDSLAYGQSDQLNEIVRNVVKSGISDHVQILPFDSLNASLRFNDHYLDFVFIDSGHTYELTKAEVRLWYEKLKVGGTLAGHDIFSEENGNEGVHQAVFELLPNIFTRPPIINEYLINEKEIVALDKFEPEQLLYTEQTENGCGVFYLKKQFYFKP